MPVPDMKSGREQRRAVGSSVAAFPAAGAGYAHHEVSVHPPQRASARAGKLVRQGEVIPNPPQYDDTSIYILWILRQRPFEC